MPQLFPPEIIENKVECYHALFLSDMINANQYLKD